MKNETYDLMSVIFVSQHQINFATLYYLTSNPRKVDPSFIIKTMNKPHEYSIYERLTPIQQLVLVGPGIPVVAALASDVNIQLS